MSFAKLYLSFVLRPTHSGISFSMKLSSSPKIEWRLLESVG